MEKISSRSEQRRSWKFVPSALTHCLWQRRFVACDADPFSFFDLRETQGRSSRLLRLGKQRIPNLVPVNEWPKAITK
ncbi:MAG: hypothetical protein K2W92_08450 [Alphaproteobacteria bacterium]|nr:hypothetical protein [Alphaproteobacteria bacterium]